MDKSCGFFKEKNPDKNKTKTGMYDQSYLCGVHWVYWYRFHQLVESTDWSTSQILKSLTKDHKTYQCMPMKSSTSKMLRLYTVLAYMKNWRSSDAACKGWIPLRFRRKKSITGQYMIQANERGSGKRNEQLDRWLNERWMNFTVFQNNWIQRWLTESMMDEWTKNSFYGCLQIHRQMSGWKEGRMDGWMDGWMDAWVDRLVNEWEEKHSCTTAREAYISQSNQDKTTASSRQNKSYSHDKHSTHLWTQKEEKKEKYFWM